MTKNKNNILSTENLAIGYAQKKQQKVIASGINFAIKKGTLNAVIGKNGIGKSTLLRTLSKVQKPLEGTLFINKKNSNAYQHLELAKTISLVLTERVPESQLTVFELIALGRQPYTNWIGSQAKEDDQLVSKIIAQLNIGQLAEQTLKTMSDGEIQKILLGRALAQDTAIVLLDEPSSHLDRYNKALLFQQIKQRVKEDQKTILFTSHDLNTAIQICDKIILLVKDRWEYGTPDELIQKGVFQSVFPKETVGFDPLQKQFRICV